MNFDYKENDRKKSFSFKSKASKIVYPNEENMIVVPITKRIEIVMSIKVCLISWMNLDYEENGGEKAFLGNPKHQYHVSKCGEHDCSAQHKKNVDYITRIQL